MTDILTLDARAAATALAGGDVSPTELVGAHVARMRAVEPSLNAVVDDMGEQALEQAAAMDAQRPADAGPLWGLPVTVKVNVDFAGRDATNGLPALAGKICADDSPVVANLKRAGAVVIGRTNVPEFSLRWFSSNPLYGQTINPVNPDLTPGGSSGGAAASLAAGVGVLAHGNDLGGSLRYPAYCVGAATLRPSMGRVPAFNPSAPAERPAALQMMSVQGIIARNMGDVALAMDPLSQRDPRDPLWSAARSCGRERPRPCRIGVAADPFGSGVHDDVAAAVDTAARAAKARGHTVVPVDLPLARDAAQAWGHLLNADTEVMMRATMDPVASPQVISVLNAYAAHLGMPDLRGYMVALATRMAVIRAWTQIFEEIDALIMPVSEQPPFAAEQDFRDPGGLGAMLDAQRPMTVVNLAGFPSAAFPTGMANGAPMGVQLLGAWRDDDFVMDIAAGIEAEIGASALPLTAA